MKCQKIITFVLIFLILFFGVLSTNSFADVGIDNCKKISFTGTDGHDYIDLLIPSEKYHNYKYSFIYLEDRCFNFVCGMTPFVVDGDGYVSSEGLGQFYEGTIYHLKGKEAWTYNTIGIYKDKMLIKDKNILYSSDNMLNTDGTIFFRKTGVLTDLAKVVKKVETKETQKEIVGILPLILVVVVSLVGLRKAWALLSRTLRKA